MVGHCETRLAECDNHPSVHVYKMVGKWWVSLPGSSFSLGLWYDTQAAAFVAGYEWSKTYQ